VDPSGNFWAADDGYRPDSGTFHTSSPILGTPVPALYSYERWSWGPLTYSFPVPNGTYLITLKFAELILPLPGFRKFNVLVNGTQMLSNFDIVAAAGGPLRAVDRNLTVTVTGGTIRITIVPIFGNAKISAIEILQTAGAGLLNPGEADDSLAQAPAHP
jgi:hypothetical protein